MNLKEQIFVRMSCRDYSDDEIDMDLIHDFMSGVRALDDSLRYDYEILNASEVNIRTRWSAPYYLAINCEKGELYLENAGFVFQQLSLYLQGLGIGSCWVGMASPKRKSEGFVIAMAFGKSENMTRDLNGFKRKSLLEISDREDERLIPAQLAPSAINSQPWYFKHSSDGFDVYRAKQNILKRQVLKKWNPIDMGICLAHMYVANEDSFEFKIKTDFENIKGYTYIGSIKI
jgi:hypothetical protein